MYEMDAKNYEESELDRQYSPAHLREGLSQKDRIIYSDNGNRSTKGNDFLKKVEKLLPRLGITRIADISFLSLSKFPVYQSCRPNYLFHSSVGPNSGALGKGSSHTQAKISCIMETFEQYCAEPRNPELIRGSYSFLSEHHVVASPREFPHVTVGGTDITTVKHGETLMWTKAYSVEADQEVLIPAECVYYPFLAQLYHTRRIFPSSSNGLSSGATYLEAAIHGIYEVIERYYKHLFEVGKLHIEALYEEELINSRSEEMARVMQNEFELQLYILEIQNIKNLPVIMCVLAGEDFYYTGYGCSSTIRISVDRAISEALQEHAACVSRARESVLRVGDGPVNVRELFHMIRQPKQRTLRLKDYKKRVYDRKFTTLRQEYAFVIRWVHQLGFPKIFIANLTRVGVDVPVVKVVVPHMEVPSYIKNKQKIADSHEDTVKKLFPIIPLGKVKF